MATTRADVTGDVSATGSASTGNEFACELGEEIIPGYCFERHDVELPGPLVMERAAFGDLDGDGADELVLELRLGSEESGSLTIWKYEPATGAVLVEEVDLSSEAFPSTRLVSGFLHTIDRDAIYRSVQHGIEVCTLQPGAATTTCDFELTNAEEVLLAAVGDVVVEQPTEELVGSSSETLEPGLQIFIGGLEYFGAHSTPPCEQLLAAAVGDFNGDGQLDIAHRSSVECTEPGDARSDDVNLLLGSPDEVVEPAAVADLGIEATDLAAIDTNDDGSAELVAIGLEAGTPACVVTQWSAGQWAAPEPIPCAPAPAELWPASLSGTDERALVFSGAETSIASSVGDVPISLGSDVGKLVAVGDLDGDGHDDLALRAPDKTTLTLLLSR